MLRSYKWLYQIKKWSNSWEMNRPHPVIILYISCVLPDPLLASIVILLKRHEHHLKGDSCKERYINTNDLKKIWTLFKTNGSKEECNKWYFLYRQTTRWSVFIEMFSQYHKVISLVVCDLNIILTVEFGDIDRCRCIIVAIN